MAGKIANIIGSIELCLCKNNKYSINLKFEFLIYFL